MLLKYLRGLILAACPLVFSACLITTKGTVSATVTVRVPPVLVVADDPVLVVIPGTYVYWLDGHDDVYFHGGYWWRGWQGGWYRADSHSGRWVAIEVRYVPNPVRHLPSDWKRDRRDGPRVHWKETRQNWRGWERDHHWEKNKWKKGR